MKSFFSSSRGRQLCFSLAPALLLSWPVFPVSAQETSLALEKVYKLTVEGDLYQAFEHLVNIPDPDKDSEAYCFIAAYLNNQIEEYASALESAEPCLNKQVIRYPEIFFQAALASFKTNDYEKAKAYLAQALEREPDNQNYAKLSGLLSTTKADSASSQLSNFDELSSIETARQFRVGLHTGFNDNVTAVPDDDTLVTVTDKESGYLGLRLNAKQMWYFPSENQLSISYDLTTKFYDSLSGYDSQFHRISALYQHRIDEHTGSQLKAEVNSYLLDGDQFRHQYRLLGGLNYRPIWRTRFKLDAALISDDYKRPVSNPALHRDTLSTQLSGTIEQSFASSRISAAIGFGAKEAEGSEYDNDYWYTHLKYTHWFSKVNGTLLKGRPVAQISWYYKNEEYDHPSIFLTDGQSQDKDIHRFGLYLGLPVSEGKSLYISYQHRDQSSNLPVYEYTQNSISFGINGTF